MKCYLKKVHLSFTDMQCVILLFFRKQKKLHFKRRRGGGVHQEIRSLVFRSQLTIKIRRKYLSARRLSNCPSNTPWQQILPQGKSFRRSLNHPSMHLINQAWRLSEPLHSTRTPLIVLLFSNHKQLLIFYLFDLKTMVDWLFDWKNKRKLIVAWLENNRPVNGKQ